MSVQRGAKVLNRLPVMLHGESGVGKEVTAKHLHNASQCTGKFVSINCASIPESLIESELFGYQAGAFTGADKKGFKGRIAEADKGTLFLDEIGDMPLALQSRLLRVLETREVSPLGSATERKIDFQLICATNVNFRTSR
ncbi:sigma 54-interacting transcriptional regulator [Alteromonas macleodii]|uniref:sigma 54-interacting transcriptional regulator n=1 Tax=Alteromonas macleodii TaxID=28108 RepID=UPI0019309ACF|nr:sigma-54 factor interaction domain-containing protein [Alteromonas macleodii]